MKIVFIHDEKLQKKDGKYYTTGGLGNSINTKYLKYFDEITLVLRSEPIKDTLNTNLREVNNRKVRVVEVEDFKTIDLKKMRKIEIKIKEEVRKADKVIIKLPSNNGEIGVKYAKIFNKPYAIELVGCPLDALNNHGSLIGKFLAPIKYRKVKKIIKKANNVLYVTEKFLQNRYPSNGTNKIGCSDVEITEVKYRNEKKNNELSKRKIKIGMIGTLTTKYKGHETIFRAIEKLKNEFNIELHLVGYGEIIKWNKLIRELQIEKNVIFDGMKKSGQEIFNWLDEMDIYAQPSLTEGMPRSTIEAMSRGCPIITTNVGGFIEINSEEFMIDKFDYKGMYEKIRVLILDNKKYNEQSKRSSNVSEKFIESKNRIRQEKFYLNIR